MACVLTDRTRERIASKLSRADTLRRVGKQLCNHNLSEKTLRSQGMADWLCELTADLCWDVCDLRLGLSDAHKPWPAGSFWAHWAAECDLLLEESRD